ncbi:MAG TPA: tRNA (guanosine(37)-N1)-methyltransferase TrmD, partial [Lachnospiraceae bacterium]|nr:tRNA (guanosine(37)-N1)-methyltransferase TrmD [Lachnospiraceae bacterium]
MDFHVLTLFPEMVSSGLNTSIIGRAIDKGLISLNTINIRDFSKDKHKRVDDYPYGGGAGMVIQAEPVYLAYTYLAGQIQEKFSG